MFPVFYVHFIFMFLRVDSGHYILNTVYVYDCLVEYHHPIFYYRSIGNKILFLF